MFHPSLVNSKVRKEQKYATQSYQNYFDKSVFLSEVVKNNKTKHLINKNPNPPQINNSRSNDAHTPLPLWIPQALHTSSTLIERGQSGTQVSRIPTVCRQQPPQQHLLFHTGEIAFSRVHSLECFILFFERFAVFMFIFYHVFTCSQKTNLQ